MLFNTSLIFLYVVLCPRELSFNLCLLVFGPSVIFFMTREGQFALRSFCFCVALVRGRILDTFSWISFESLGILNAVSNAVKNYNNVLYVILQYYEFRKDWGRRRWKTRRNANLVSTQHLKGAKEMKKSPGSWKVSWVKIKSVSMN